MTDIGLILQTIRVLHEEAYCDLRAAPIDSVAWGHADGRRETCKTLLDYIVNKIQKQEPTHDA